MQKPPAPVTVQNEEPISVTVDERDTDAQATARTVAAGARTEAEVLRTADQRRISGIWERTQQIIALSVVEITLLVAATKAIEPLFRDDNGTDATTAGVAFVFLASVSNLVIGFYFGRTNHTRVGGDPGPVEGR